MRKPLLVSILLVFTIASALLITHYPKIHSEREFGEKEQDDAQEEVMERIRQEVLMTKDPKLGYVPTERLEAARRALISHPNRATTLSTSPNSSSNTILSTGLTWTERGPNNIGGRCRAILIDQSDPTGNTVIVGSVSGGLWQTTNFLSASPTWTQNTTVSANLAITSIAQDPSNPLNMYAGTGEGYNNIDAVRGLGIYKSTDGGNTWNLLPSTTTGGSNVNDFGYVQKVAVYSNGYLYASGISATYCNAGGVLQSTDGGNTWTRVIGLYSGGGSCANAVDFNGYDIEFSAGGDIYASVIDVSSGKPNGKIYKSPAGPNVGNAGTWTNVAPAAGTGNYWQRIQIACSPINNNRVYAIFQGSGSGIGSIFRTDNGGANWTNISNHHTWCDGGASNGKDFSRGQAWYDLTLTINPSDDTIVYAGGVDIFTTNNSGSTWSQLTQWDTSGNCGTNAYVHADIHNITFLPGSSTNLIVGCDGGIFYSANSGTSFASKNRSLNVTQYYATAVNPTAGSNYFLAGAQDNGSHIFNSPGMNSVTYATGGDGGFCFIDQNNPNYQITSYTDATYYLSTNGGASFGTLLSSTNGRFINPADYDNTTKYLYCAYSDQQLLRVGQVNSGSPSNTSFNVTANAQLQVSAVKVDPNTTDSVWVAFSTASDASSDQVPALYVIGGASTGTQTINQITGLTLPSGSYISSIDVETGNANHLIVTVSNYGVASIWETTDKGTTWTSLDNNGVNLPDVPVRWGMIVPATANVGDGGSNGGIMIATELGVWSTSTTNGTSTIWSQNANNMGNVRTDMLKFRSVDNLVVAATHGRGLFSTNLVSTPLPVTFVSFSGIVQNNYNSLQWNVTNEYNDKGFEVQRQYPNENNFTSVGFVPSNNSTSTNQYGFIDNQVDLGQPIVNYRLMQTDLDGKSTFSSILVLKRNASTQMVQYISVNGNSLYLRLNNENPNEILNAQVYNIAGQRIMNKNIIDQSQYLDINNLSKGVYVLRLYTNNGEQYSQKFVK